MSEHVDLVIADLTEKRDKLSDLIAKLEWFKIEFPRTAASLVATDGGHQRPPKKAKAVTKSLPDDADVGTQENGRREKILAALQAGPLATRDVAAIVKVDRRLTKMTLQRMKKVALVTSVGVGPGTKWALPGPSRAKEGL